MALAASLASGAIGAGVLNATHETARKLLPTAPHVDLIGMRALGKPLQKLGHAPNSMRSLRRWTLAGDLLSNALYYGATVRGWKSAWISGLAAGLGAVVIPPVLGLGRETTRRPSTALMTVAWYTIGALATAAALRVQTSDYPHPR